MNNLEKLAKKYGDKKELVSKLKGAYRAAAKEGDKTIKKADKMKTANIEKVKANLAAGMGMMEAIKKAYPDYTEEQVKALAAKMGGMGKQAKAHFSKKHDDSAHLTDKQKKLPDFIQEKIVAKKAGNKSGKDADAMNKKAMLAAALSVKSKEASFSATARALLSKGDKLLRTAGRKAGKAVKDGTKKVDLRKKKHQRIAGGVAIGTGALATKKLLD